MTCTGDLSNIGTGDFEIDFTIQTTQTNPSGNIALLNQRASCSPSTFWDITINDNAIQVETDSNSGADDAQVSGFVHVNDGTAHAIVVQQKSQVLTIYVDGVEDISGATLASFGSLPALVEDTSVCVGVASGTVALTTGSISSVCVSTTLGPTP